MGKLLLAVIIVFSTVTKNGNAQENNYFGRMAFGVEVGSWQPNNLRNSESKSTFIDTKENLYLGTYLSTPLFRNLSFRLTCGYYNYNKDNRSILLIPILFDLKYLLISGSKISPYLSYGLGASIGKNNKNKLGYCINFGTGFDLLLTKHLAFGVEFRYHYLKYSEVFIFTDDYSGPKVNITLFYIL